jgi:protein-S-isoprenylcysteine O-methyltransferase Ste14
LNGTIERMTSEAPAGAWLFRYRSFLPVPLALMLLLIRTGEVDGRALMAAGALIVVTGQSVRLWSVRHIGTISRTRTTRYGPLMTAGPYAIVRNPLYVGNWLLWTGFAVWSRLLWMLPVAWIVFFVQYRAIAKWEAGFIRSKYLATYDEYAREVRAWMPRWPPRSALVAVTPLHPWREVFFSERGTLLAVALMSLLLTIKQFALD